MKPGKGLKHWQSWCVTAMALVAWTFGLWVILEWFE